MSLERLDAQVEWLAEIGLVVLTVIGISAIAIPIIVYWRRNRSERRHRRISEQRRGDSTHIDLFKPPRTGEPPPFKQAEREAQEPGRE